MFSCGINSGSQIDKKSNNKNSSGIPIMSPPVKFHSDTTSFSSISISYSQMVFITKPGKSYVRGDNSDGVISGSLPKTRFTEDTEFSLKDEGGHPCKFISVVCGSWYTLYLVSDESGVSNFRLVYCYKWKTPNPLFVNIGNRTPRALFGGYFTSGVIDSEGGIIVITESVFESPTEKIETTFLPNGDKAVKLACCDRFVISLGESGRVYMSRILGSSPPKFSEVTGLSGKTVVDVTGTRYHCFAVLNDGRVFGYGDNGYCCLGLPEETYSVSRFTEIDSLKKHKIVSAFAGSYHSVFKTSEGKMIVCGSNDYGQLFIPPKDIVYPPEEVKDFEGVTFCIVGCDVSSAFVGIDPPPNVGNKKISDTVETSEKVTKSCRTILRESTSKSDMKNVQNELAAKDEEISRLREEISRMKASTSKKDEEISQLKASTSKKDEEISRLNEEISRMKTSTSKKDEEISRMKASTSKKDEEISRMKASTSKKDEEISRLKEEKAQLQSSFKQLDKKVKKYEGYLSSQKEKPQELTIVDLDDYKEESVIGEGSTSIVKIVLKSEKYAKKELLLFDYKAMQRFLFESEVLFKLRHPCIIRVYGFSNGDDTHKPSLILSLEPSSLEASIKNHELDMNQKNRITVELVLGMRYIHRHKFMHRDLKPSNILLSKKQHVRISDFGLAKEEDLETSRTKGVGTMRFMAPELFEENEEAKDYTNKVDVYSFGIILIFIVTESYPPFGLKRVLNGVLPKLPENVTSWVRELIFSCLSVESENRPSFAEIYEIMKANNFDLFSESKNKKLTHQQVRMKEMIETRVRKIEAFEFQHQDE